MREIAKIMTKDYREGPKARDEFERTMTTLFKAPKPKGKRKPKLKRKQNKRGKD
jgi:hypothetical protein